MMGGMPTLDAVVTRQVRGTAADVFDHIVPIELSTIFTGYGPLPAVARTENQTGPWDAVGQSRTVVLADGGSAREELIAFEKGERFAYRIGEVRGRLALVASGALGEWWFTQSGSESTPVTNIRWRYEFLPRSAVAVPALLVVRSVWGRYMAQALEASCAPFPTA